jgi:hypothetical protein
MTILLNLPGGTSAAWLVFMIPVVIFILVVKGVQWVQYKIKQRRNRKEPYYTTMEEINLN